MSSDGTGTAPASSSRKRLFLHVGEPKTGTTFLQMVMWTNRAELAGQGVAYPGPKSNAHWRASQDVREIEQEEGDPAPPFTGEWDNLVERAMRARHTGVISHELFAAATREQAARALASVARYEVHLVMTVRDLGSLLPAEWQETVKHGNTRRWVDWVEDVVRESQLPNRHDWGFWKVHDTLEIVKDWTQDVIPPERVHIITMPSRTASDSLWDRFSRVVGIDNSVIDTTRARANVSLGVAEVELVRRLNATLREDYPGWSYQWFVKDTLAHATFPKREMSTRLQLFPGRYEWAAKQADALITGLRESGYDLVGDLEELRPARPAGPSLAPGEVSNADLLDTALFGMTGLLDRLDRMRTNMNELQLKVQGDTPQTAVEYIPEYSPLKNKLIALSEQHAALTRARHGYWRAMHLVRHNRARVRKLRGMLTSSDRIMADPSTIGLSDTDRGGAKGTR